MFTYIGLSLCVIAYFALSWIRRHVRVPELHRKYVLITGCDTGFGNFLAQRLDMLGVHVFAACLTEAAQARLKMVASSRLCTLTLDITNPDQMKQAVDFVRQNLPENEGLWGLVNNAGILGSKIGPPEWLSTEDYAHVIDVNTIGTIRTTLAFLPLVKKVKGRIVNMSSMAARFSHPFTIPYNISKAGIEAFSDGIRAHLAQYGVSVHIIEPGSFQTGMNSKEALRKVVQKGWDRAPRYIREEYGKSYFENLTALCTEGSKMASPHVNKVVNAYVHALTARCPRLRYSVGWDAKLFFLPLSYAPSMWFDFVFARITKSCVPVALEAGSEVIIPGSLKSFGGGVGRAANSSAGGGDEGGSQ